MRAAHYSENDVKKAREALKLLMQTIAVSNYEYIQREDNGIREKGIFSCLRRAVQLTAGIIVLSENQLVDSMAVLHRSLLDCLIWSCWIVKSEENARYYDDHAIMELARISRMNIQDGYATIRNIADNTEVSPDEYHTILSRYKSHKHKKINVLAEEVGLGRLYTMLYGYMSLEVHPSNLSNNNVFPDLDRIYAILVSSIGFLNCINLINTNWLTIQQQTPLFEIKKILGL